VARDLVIAAIATQIDQVRTGGQFDSDAVRAAVAAEQRGEHLDADDLRRLADQTLAHGRERLEATDEVAATRVHDSITAQYRAAELRRLAQQRTP